MTWSVWTGCDKGHCDSWVNSVWSKSWFMSSDFDWVSLGSVGILVSGSVPAATLLLGHPLKWCSSSSVQIKPFNWPPAPWIGANYSSLSLMLCMSALVFKLHSYFFFSASFLFLYIVIFIITFISIRKFSFSKYFLVQWQISGGKIPPLWKHIF